MSKLKEKELKLRSNEYKKVPRDVVVKAVFRINSKGKRKPIDFKHKHHAVKVSYKEDGHKCKVVVQYERVIIAIDSNTVHAWPLAVVPAIPSSPEPMIQLHSP